MSIVPEPPLPDALPEQSDEQPLTPTEPQIDRGVGQVYLLFAICVCLVVSVGWVGRVLAPRVTRVLNEPLLVLLPAVLFVRLKGLPIAASLGWRPVSPALALFSVVLGVSGMSMATEIRDLLIPYIGYDPWSPADEFATPSAFMLGLFCSTVFPGVCEETLFRGAIQGTLGRLGPVKAVLITSFLFALFHLDPWHFAAPLFAGIVFGILTIRSGSTIPAMIAHASGNAFATATNYLLHDDRRIFLLYAILSPVFVVAFPIYLLKTRQQTTDPGPLARVPAALAGRALAGTLAAGVVVVWLAFFVFSNWVGWHFVTASEESLGLHQGDRVLLLKGPLAQVGVDVGSIVELSPDGQSRLVKVKRCDERRIWIVGWPEGVTLKWHDITGRPIQITSRDSL